MCGIFAAAHEAMLGAGIKRGAAVRSQLADMLCTGHAGGFCAGVILQLCLALFELELQFR